MKMNKTPLKSLTKNVPMNHKKKIQKNSPPKSKKIAAKIAPNRTKNQESYLVTT